MAVLAWGQGERDFVMSRSLLAASLALACAVASGCGATPTRASGRSLTRQALSTEYGWLVIDGVPQLQQRDAHDGGATALAMVLSYWRPTWPRLRGLSPSAASKSVSAGMLCDRARALGFSAFVVSGTLADIEYELGSGRPTIASMVKDTVIGRVARYEVIVGFHRRSQRIATIDPAHGMRQHSLQGFLREWDPAGRELLLLLPQARSRSHLVQLTPGPERDGSTPG